MQGSAVAISKNLLITNAHVVRNSKFLEVCRGTSVKNRGRVMKAGKVLDLAMVECAGNTEIARLAQRFWEGERITTVGYGFGSDTPLVTQGYLSKVVYYHGFPVLGMISAKTFNGQSGGGVFNTQMELIGIITANAENKNDRIYEDLGFCILNTVFPVLQNSIRSLRFNYLWEETRKEFVDLFNFQTTSYLPQPKV